MDPQTLQRAQRDYLESRILSAHPVELVHMLYQVAIDNLNASIEHLKSGDRFARATTVSRAQEAVNELRVSLDHSVNASFISTLAGLYEYVVHQIINGHAQQAERPFREALAILTTLATAWEGVKDQICGAESAASEIEEEEAEPVAMNRYGSPSSAYADGPAVAVLSRDWSG